MKPGDPKLGPVEQQTGDYDPPFAGGGRRADLPADYQQRKAADADYNANLATVKRWDREAVGTPRTLDGTPWVNSGKGHPKGRNAR